MSAPPSTAKSEIIFESSIWTPQNLTKKFDWISSTFLQAAEPEDLQFYVQQYFELENCDETLAKAIFVDYCVDLITFVQEQNLSEPCALYFLNLMLDFYINAGTSTLEECVTTLRSQLLSASALSGEAKPTVMQIEEVPLAAAEEQEEAAAAAAPEEKKKAKGKKGKDKKAKAAEAEAAPPAETSDAEEQPQEPQPQVERIETPVEVVFTPQEIESIISYVTAGFFRHFKLFRYVTTHSRRIVGKQHTYRLVVQPIVPPPFSLAVPKEPTPPSTPKQAVVQETPEERVTRLITEAITKSLAESKEELALLMQANKDTLLTKISKQLGVRVTAAPSQSTSPSPSPPPAPSEGEETEG